jgi:hypothetical protein
MIAGHRIHESPNIDFNLLKVLDALVSERKCFSSPAA